MGQGLFSIEINVLGFSNTFYICKTIRNKKIACIRRRQILKLWRLRSVNRRREGITVQCDRMRCDNRQRLLSIARRADERVAQSRNNEVNNQTTSISDSNEQLPAEVAGHTKNEDNDLQNKHGTDEAPNIYDWARLDRYANIIQSLEESKELMEKREMQKKIREDLSKQMVEQRRRKQKEQEENLDYARNVNQEVDQWREYDKQVIDNMRHKAAIERLERDEQIRFNTNQKRLEVEKRSREDSELLKRITEEIQNEEREKIERKKKERNVMQRLISENEKEQQRKFELKRLSTEAELAQIREYNALIEKQESGRQAELNRRLERQRLLIRKMEENVLKTIQAKADDDNQRALMQQAERDARDLEVEKFKQDHLTQMRHDMIRMLQEQIAEKHSRKREEAQLRELHSSILKADTAAFERTERDKKMSRRATFLKYREQLREQISQSRSLKATADDKMTEEEIRLNSDLIAVVERVLRDDSINEAMRPT
jgi:hypothetical protein